MFRAQILQIYWDHGIFMEVFLGRRQKYTQKLVASQPDDLLCIISYHVTFVIKHLRCAVERIIS